MLSTHAQAAKEIRIALKAINVKASVKSESYSGGNSVTVQVQDVTPALFARIKHICEKHQSGHFDGMEDIYKYSNHKSDVAQVKFVQVYNSFSDSIRQKVLDLINSVPVDGLDLGPVPEKIEEVNGHKLQGLISDTLSGRSSIFSKKFWSPDQLLTSV